METYYKIKGWYSSKVSVLWMIKKKAEETLRLKESWKLNAMSGPQLECKPHTHLLHKAT